MQPNDRSLGWLMENSTDFILVSRTYFPIKKFLGEAAGSFGAVQQGIEHLQFNRSVQHPWEGL